MERNVQIKKLRRPRLQNAIIGGAAFAALFLVTACGRGGQMEDAYSFDSRATAFSSSGTGSEGRGTASREEERPLPGISALFPVKMIRMRS